MADQAKHLLLVEDEAPLRQAIAEQLADRGFQVEQADSGEAALARLADFAFDIIVTDLRLAGHRRRAPSSKPPSGAIPTSSPSSSPATAR